MLDEPSGSETSNTSAEEEVADESEQEHNENKGMGEGNEKEEAHQEEVTEGERNDEENISSEIEVTPSPTDEGEKDNLAMESSETTTPPVNDDEKHREEDDDDPFGDTGEDDLFFKPEKPISIEERPKSSSEEDDIEYAETNADLEKAEGLSCCRC